jgi:hypothetical protein
MAADTHQTFGDTAIRTCPRHKTLHVAIPNLGSQGPIRRLIASTGIKLEGEGDWSARKLGVKKRRVWRKIPIGIG